MVISVICDGAIDGVIDGALDSGALEGPGWGESFLCNILLESAKVIFLVQITPGPQSILVWKMMNVAKLPYPRH